MLRNLRGLLVFAAVSLNTIFWCLPLFALALIKLVIPWRPFRRWITRLLMAIGENWISVNRLLFAASGSAHWRIEDDSELQQKGWYLVFSNHQTWVDIVVLQAAFNRKIPFLKFFIKRELIWIPFIGLAWWALDMPFMKRFSPSYLAKHPEKKGADLEATRRACKKFSDTPTSVINFVEGTRFSEEKREQRNSPYRNLLSPRAGGVAIALSSMGELFDAVLDITIVYPDGAPEFWDMCCGDVVKPVVECRMRPIDKALLAGDYEQDREFRRSVHAWLGTLWAEKDARIDELRGRSQLDSRVA